MSKESKFVSAVIYMHNEQKNIQVFLSTVHRFLQDHFTKYEVICVDDASSDDSVKRIRELVERERLENVSLVSMSVYHGRELGMEAGVDLSIGDYVFEIEWIDMQDTTKYADKLWEAYCRAVDGYDIVTFASESNKDLGSAIFYNLYNSYNRSYMELMPERFRIVTRRAINRASRMSKTILYRKALYANSGLKTCVIGDKMLKPFSVNKNVAQNKSKTGMSVLLAYTGLFPKIGLIGELCMVLLFVAFLVASCLPGLKTELPRIGMVVFGVGSFLGGIGFLIIKYCELLLELILKKENYVVSSVEKLVNSEHLN
jgi:dolichol-phosphate mannosyltransferase